MTPGHRLRDLLAIIAGSTIVAGVVATVLAARAGGASW